VVRVAAAWLVLFGLLLVLVEAGEGQLECEPWGYLPRRRGPAPRGSRAATG